MRTANEDRDNSQLNQSTNTCSQRLTFLHNAAMLAWRFTHVHIQIQADAPEAPKLPMRGNSGGR